MYRLDAWVQEPFIFLVRGDGDTLLCYRIPDMTPLGTDQDNTRPVHQLSGPAWQLPGLQDIKTNIDDGPLPPVSRYHSTAHPGSWRAPSNNPCITTVSLHATSKVHGGVRVDPGGGMFIIDTRPDANGEVILPGLLPSPPSNDYALHLPELTLMLLSLHPSSRIHLVDDLLTSIGVSALPDNDTRTIYMNIRAYLFSKTGHLVQWPTESQVPTGIPWEKHKRIKITSPPCSVTGTFLASEKSIKKTTGGITLFVTRVWLLMFH